MTPPVVLDERPLPEVLSLLRVQAAGPEERFVLRRVERPGDRDPETLLAVSPATAVALAKAILELTGGRVLPFPSRPAPAPAGGAA